MPDLSRRTLIAGFATAAGAALAQPLPASFGRVAVDVAPLRAQGVGPFADLLAEAVLAEARAAFAGRLGGGGPTLVIRLTGLSLRSYAGGGGSGRGGRGGGGDNDYLEGEALAVGPRGEVLARHPQLYAQPSSHGGAWYTPGNEERRTAELARNYVAWLRRALPG